MKNISGVLKGINDKKIADKKPQHYIPSGFLRTVHNTPEDFIRTAELCDVAQKTLLNATFNDKAFSAKLLLVTAMALSHSKANLDETSERMKKIAEDSDMRECGKKFVESYGVENFTITP